MNGKRLNQPRKPPPINRAKPLVPTPRLGPRARQPPPIPNRLRPGCCLSLQPMETQEIVDAAEVVAAEVVDVVDPCGPHFLLPKNGMQKKYPNQLKQPVDHWLNMNL